MIIGPFTVEDWITMGSLRGIISFMKERNTNNKYDLGIKAESERYQGYLDKYRNAA